MEEIWKSVVGYEGYYEVSNFGDVRSVDRTLSHKRGYEAHYKSKPCKQSYNTSKYLCVSLSKDNKQKFLAIHRLVAISFLGLHEKLTVNHIDGNKENNRLENLEWISIEENLKHSWKSGLRDHLDTKGDLNGNKSLTGEQVIEIRRRLDNGETQYKLHKEYGVSKYCIHAIHRRRTWTHI